MKKIVLFLLFCFCFSSHGLSYLNVCYGDDTRICKRNESKVVPSNALCEVPEDSEADASDYDLTIVGPLPDRPWTTSEVVAPNEAIACALNTVRKQARIDSLNAAQQTKIDAMNTLKFQCQSVADPFRNAVCEILGAK